MQSRVIDVCAQCKGALILASDEQGRRWAVCTQCGAQYPPEQGHLIVGRQPNKAVENS